MMAEAPKEIWAYARIEQLEAERDAAYKRGLEEALEIASRGYEYVEGVIHGIKERIEEIDE